MVGLSLMLIACGGAPDDPEQQIRAVIFETEQAAENGSTRRVMQHVSDNYRDDRGRGKDDIRNYVRAYLLQRDNLGLSTRIQAIEIVTQARAHAQVQLRMADSAGQRARAVSGLGNHVDIELTFDLEDDGQWRVIRAEWSGQQ